MSLPQAGLIMLMAAHVLGAQIAMRDPRWRTVGAGPLASRPSTCTANRDVYICNGAGCDFNGQYHYCTAANVWTPAMGGGGAGTGVLLDRASFLLCIGTPCSAGSDLTNHLPVVSDGRFSRCWIRAKQPPTGSDLVVDVLRNGTSSIFGPSGFSLPAGQYQASISSFASPDVSEGDYLTVSILSVGSGFPGQDVSLVCVKSTPEAYPFVHSTFMAANCQAGSAALGFAFGDSGFPEAVCVNGANTVYGVARFSDEETQSVQMHLPLPSDWDGTLAADLLWQSAATSGSVVWQLQTACAAAGETGDPSWNAAQQIVDPAASVSGALNPTGTLTLTVSGCSAGEELFLRLFRDPAHPSDTLSAAADLVWLRVRVGRIP